MEPNDDPDAATAGTTQRQRVTNACEACRAAKVKCQPSVQVGICRRNQDAPRPPPPPGPSKTFSIDFEMPQTEDVDDVDGLAARHERYFEEFMPPESDIESIDAMLGLTDSGSGPHSVVSSPPSTGPSVSVSNFGLKPQFNLDSAEKLLQTFRVMLKHFPCVSLPPDATVMSLAKTKPFLLLAILSTASGSSGLQGHTLYDEEFRKILGLKFVAGGERTLELLQGLLIYTAWYPFHLRPKSKQAFQYVRMAAEILHDLELDHPPPQDRTGTGINPLSTLAPERMDGIRAYLSCYYLISAHVLPFLQYSRKTYLTDASFGMAWAKTSVVAIEFTSWTATCCDLLERCSALKGDHTLAWLIRLFHITEEATEMSKTMPLTEQAKQQVHFMHLGLESQLREWKSRIPSSLGDIHSVNMLNIFSEIFLLAAPIFRLRSTAKMGDDVGPPIPVSRLERCLTLLRSFFDYIVNLDRNAFAELSATDWGYFIQATIVAIRVSFPMPLCPEWDHARAREQLQFDSYLSRLSADAEELTPSSKSMDALAASRVIFAVIKRKYEARVASVGTPVHNLPRSVRGCPMLDGSLDQYFPVWDQDLSRNGTHGLVPPANGMMGGQAAYNDLWTTMNMSWPEDMTGGLGGGQNEIGLGQEQDLSVQLDSLYQGGMNLGPSPRRDGE
ncbi:hypothetical protein CCHL11_07711 [Colletotrichum chlorophyti]|uniref:Zn(2)-C6 fungal-type domain-containing protein n=1 Tax=Colletotrichum chlorophyti TaxID=708187 RepID=A0A1Q8S720_9PEZI|nr:hypothetical protein CCHL11_07711 [Colletotrichum chlorophyti]